MQNRKRLRSLKTSLLVIGISYTFASALLVPSLVRRSTAFEIATRRIAMTTDASSVPSVTNNDPLSDRGFKNPLVLGSGSFTRRLILKEMGVPFHRVVRPIDEKSVGADLRSACDHDADAPSRLVTRLASAKADALVEGLEDGSLALPPRSDDDDDEWVVLTADQVVVATTTDNDGRRRATVLEKPVDENEARSFVARYATSPPRTVGACVLTHLPTRIRASGVDTAEIRFRPDVADPTNDLVGALLKDGAPVLDCAGGLMVEHPLVKDYIEEIVGTEDSVMGLSKALVLRLLDELQEKVAAVDEQTN